MCKQKEYNLFSFLMAATFINHDNDFYKQNKPFQTKIENKGQSFCHEA